MHVIFDIQLLICSESGGRELSSGKEEHSSLPPKELPKQLPPIPLPTTGIFIAIIM